ncbi:hypothetical protein N7510_001833 [Penicillium lagena]|uniref:uncharacterized protein n=1 Tax=Penicillium lagena TaxID=94218 RepID=UPI002541D47C|nr:uncharacterized protein N7510_001833 [Penicillium lagena]KAJ5625524.1 hypothetical protein N7510_001833 [Penicillium lagena]
MSSLQTFMLVVDHDKDEAKRIAESVAQDVESKKTTLIEVVQSLVEYVNDEDPILRGKAVSYLAAVIRVLSPKYLTRQQIQVLTTFFCDRIEDGGAVAGLDTLQGLDRFNKELAVEDLQSRSQSQRFQVYQLMNEIMSRHRAALQEMGDTSLVGVVDLMTGEKDPRNLMIVFSILKVVMVEWDISNHVELLFDAVYNYFPITFRPPPNDPYGITAQDLKGRLQDCISSTRYFAPHAIPALLDKLDSTSPNVKKDALNTLIACIHSYDPDTVSRYSITIWEVLKFEILNAQEEFLSEYSLEALKGIAQRLSGGSQRFPRTCLWRSIFDLLRRNAMSNCKNPSINRRNLPNRFWVQCRLRLPLHFLSSFRLSLLRSLRFIKRLMVLQNKELFLKHYLSCLSLPPRSQGEIALENPLLEFKDQFSDVLGQALMGSAKEEISFRVTALKGFLRLSTLRDFFQDNEIGLFVQYLDEILLKEESVGRDDLKREAIAALAEISKHKPRLIMDITFPAFVATLPDQDEGSDSAYLPTLETLAQISVERDIFETLFRRLFSKLTILLQKEQPGSVAYPRAILVTLLYVMQQRKMDQDPSLDLYYDKVVVGLCRNAAAAASGNAKNRILNDAGVLDMLGRLCNLLVRSISVQKQEQVADNVYSLFSSSEEFTPLPLTETTTADQERTIIISTFLLAGLSADCSKRIPHTSPDMKALLSDVVRRSISDTTESATHLAFLRHLALLTNKFLSKQDLNIAETLFDALLPTQQALSPSTIRTIFWLSKALVLRLAPSTTHILTSLLSLLSSPDQQTSTIAARSFAIILGDDEVISATNGASIRLLAKQRVFATVVPLISSRIREVNVAGTNTDTASEAAHIKSAHLTALAGILSTIPASLVMPELPTLLPLLLQTLDLQSADSTAVRAATLDTLAVIIRDNGVGVIDECGHVKSLVTRLLKTTTRPETGTAGFVNSPRLRVEALKCLFLLASQQPSTASVSPLLQVKSEVLRSLRRVLDDPKRDVRKAAVDARGAWLRGVDDASEDED